MSDPTVQPAEVEELSGKLVVHLTAETYAARFLTLALSFASNILLARLLGPEGKGYIATALLWSGLVASVLVFGLDSSAIRYIGKSPGRSRQLAKLFVIHALAMTLVGTVVLWGVRQWTGLFSGEPELAWAFSGLLLTGLLAILFYALYIGLGQLSRTNRVAVAGSVLNLCFLLAIFALGRSSIAVVIWGIVGLQALTSAYLVIRAFASRQPGPAEPIPWPDFGRYTFKTYAANLAGLLYSRSNLMMLSVSAAMSEVGIYSIALVFADVVLILPNTLINITFPRVSAMARGLAIQRVSETSRFAALTALVIAVVVGLAASILIPLAFGKAFQPAIGMAWILCAGAWVGASGMVLSTYFYGTGKPEVPASAAWLGFAAVAALTFGLAPHWGGYGAAVAVSLSRLVVTGYILVFYVRDSREHWTQAILVRPADWRRGIRLLQSMLASVHGKG